MKGEQITKPFFVIDDEMYIAIMSDLEQYVLNDQGLLL